MLTNKEKRIVENYLYKLIKESMFEDFFPEAEKKHKSHKKHEDDDNDNKLKKKSDTSPSKSAKKRSQVTSWLKKSNSSDTESYSLNHADIMRKLWHPKDQKEEDAKRHLFSVKLNNEENDNGSIYSFSDSEINKLYDIMNGL